MSPANRPNGGKRKAPKKDGSNARERARLAAEKAALRRKRRNVAIAVVAAAVLIIGAGVGFAAWRTYGNPSAEGEYGEPWPRIDVTAGAPITVGSDNAPTTLTIYEDFRCPHCKEFEDRLGETLNEMQENGEVKLEYRMVAYIDSQDQGSGSLNAANAFACAASEGFGEEFYNAVYDNYGKAWNNDQLIDLANQAGEPSQNFAGCVNNGEHTSWVDANMQQADEDGVEGTPALLVNGQIQGNAISWDEQQLRDAVSQAQ